MLVELVEFQMTLAYPEKVITTMTNIPYKPQMNVLFLRFNIEL
jgi:hypothetical protein